MIIVSYQNTKSFLAVMQEILEENEVANSLMLGILLRLQEKQEKGEVAEMQPFMRTTHDQHGIVTAALFTPPNRPVILYNDRSHYQDSLSIIAADIVHNKWTPSGVIAPGNAAETFARIWSKTSGLQATLSLNERLYECKQVNSQNLATGQLRPATDNDRSILTEWSLAFTRECGMRETEEQINHRLDDVLKAQTAYLWENSGHPVSMVLKTRPTSHTISISGVFTPPSLRGRGFATAAVSTLTEQLLESGYQTCNLFTDLTNPTSNAIYQRIGYVPVTDYNFYQFAKTPISEE